MSQEQMAENQPEEVKNVSANASAAEGSEAQATPPEGAQPSPEQEEQRVPYSRFKEVIEEKNSLGGRIAELESQLQEMAESKQGPSAYERALERFKSLGLDERSTKALADTAAEIASEISDKRVSKLEEQHEERNMLDEMKTFAERHPEAEKYVGVMNDMWDQSDPDTQALVAKNPKIGLELLLAKSKEILLDDAVEQARQEEREYAQNGFNTKKALSGASGRGTARIESMPDPEDIENMSEAEYMKKRDMLLSPRYAEYVAKRRKGG